MNDNLVEHFVGASFQPRKVSAPKANIIDFAQVNSL